MRTVDQIVEDLARKLEWFGVNQICEADKAAMAEAINTFADDQLEKAAGIAEFHSGPAVQCAEKIRDLKHRP